MKIEKTNWSKTQNETLCNGEIILQCFDIFFFYISEKTRARFVNLVSQAYSSISLAEFSTYVGLGELEAGELASQQPGKKFSYTTYFKI